MPRALALVLALLALLLPGVSHAHGLRTAYLEVIEVTPGHASVHLRMTGNDPTLTVVAGGSCALVEAGDGDSPYDRAWLLACPAGLEGGWLELRGLGPIVSDAVVWTSFADGSTASRVLTTDAPRATLASSVSALSVARAYVERGVVHV